MGLIAINLALKVINMGLIAINMSLIAINLAFNFISKSFKIALIKKDCVGGGILPLSIPPLLLQKKKNL